MPISISKPWYRSITVWAGLFQMVSGAGLIGGLQIDFVTGDFTGNFRELFSSIAPVFTGVATIYGRARARFTIK